ncbi:MAG: hypothetical protein JO081_05465 [Alphaproteobacteria bacterium]|nr:hypothetical protein [Alphaproteobacteria bacterium]
MSNIDIDALRRQLDRIDASRGAEAATTGGGNGAPPRSGSWLDWRASVDARLEGLKSAIESTRWVVGIIAVVVTGGFSFLGFQLNRIEARVDRVEAAVAGIPARLSEEFRAMRPEMAAQTSAIASSITATREAQPSTPQIIVVPTPQPGSQPPAPPKP